MTRCKTRTTGIATCVEGISVDANTPGFNSLPFVALVNAQGIGAPKTNVARSSLEETPESEALRRIVYRLYFEQIRDEAIRLNREEGYSQTWATGQIQYIASPIVSKQSGITSETLHQEELLALPMFLIERNKKRSIAAASELKSLGRFWTVQSELMSMVERLVRESPAEVSAAALIEVCKTETTELPPGEVVSNLFGLPPSKRRSLSRT
jgi:molecular chaperone HtpG